MRVKRLLQRTDRRLIEKEFPAGRNRRYALPELRKLLEDHIFGVDRDADACSVTELSLTLTLLDYIDPPDLNGDERRKLPSLRGRNIFRADFFDDESPCADDLKQRRFEWIVGNPPWKKLKSEHITEEDGCVLSWITDNEKHSPVGKREVARAFAWSVTDYLAHSGEIALLLPAMSLFEKDAQGFRAAFFKRMKVHGVVNFANLTEVLFAGRSRVPPAAFFYGNRTVSERIASSFSKVRADESVTAYSPFVANQEPTRPTDGKTRSETWSLVIGASELRHIPVSEVLDGGSLPWKLAMWGSHLDRRLLAKLECRFPSIADLENDNILIARQGPELKAAFRPSGPSTTIRIKDVVGKYVLDVKKLARLRHVFSFPNDAILENQKLYLSVRGGEGGLAVCKPPHVVVNAGRNFAIYTDDYIIVPPRQIGIISPANDRSFPKALSLFLSSDFAFYHQFLTSSQFGIKRDVATLDALKNMPIPLHKLARRVLNDWTKLHAELVRMPPWTIGASPTGQKEFSFGSDTKQESVVLLNRLNDLVGDILGLDVRERALVHDLKHVRLELNDGRTGQLAVRPPEPKEMRAYSKRLKSELDAFIGNELSKRHSVGVVYDTLSAMICVNLTRDGNAARKIIVEHADNGGARQLERTRRRLRQKVSQWVYFDRNLRLYEGTRTYLFKPMQRFHWTESQAMCDAGEIIAETLAG